MTVTKDNENGQGDLFGTLPHLLHRLGDPDTSLAAAYSVKTTKWERLVFMACWASMPDGIENTSCALLLKTKPDSTSPRWAGLRRKFLVYDSGIRRASPLTTHKQIVWKINPFVKLTETGDIVLNMQIERLAKDETPPLDDKWKPITFDEARGIFKDNFKDVTETLEALEAGREIETNFFYYRRVNRES